ncbi:acyl-CoA dehydrogenase [Marisediminitalea sp.]|uniref:acyl-CoA dehydrogenase n=1 Tax=Marisediminitalea sp. TaxID=2662268 RepID=UPI003519C398
MSNTLMNFQDLNFLLYDVLDVEKLTAYSRFNDHSRETFDATIETAYSIARDWFAPCAAKLDEHEPQFIDGKVDIIPEVSAALEQYYEAGFGSATHDYELGGMQLPFTVSVACKAIFGAANMPILSYPSLTNANANVIRNFGSEQQRQLYLAPMLEGRFMGTMALTEPQAGSSLSDIKTTALPADDGTYRLSGNKIFISGGDHELSENIIHLVLARIQGAPEGVKGLSLFIVPKILVNEDGSLGERNDVNLAGLIHKMGWRGTTSTMLNFGEKEGAVGYLVGEPNRGLLYMFQMMNEARIGVGVGAVSQGYTSYLHALDYARNRPQGRHPHEKDPTTAQLPITAHSDIKRMLLAAKSYVEGSLCLSLYGATLADTHAHGSDPVEAKRAGSLLDILTPILKSWPSKYCLEANAIAIQVHGGYGYTREYPVERFYRDNRLNPIHEGTEGIQALDLLGRKISMQNGLPYKLLSDEIQNTVAACKSIPQLAEFADALGKSKALLDTTTQTLVAAMRDSQANQALANATLYLHTFGHVVVAWLWLRQARVALSENQESTGHERRLFLEGKLAACKYFYRYELPQIDATCNLLQSMDESCFELDPDWL